MNEPDLSILNRFAGYFDPDAEGRDAEPPRETATLLKRFAAGEATAAERARAAAVLKEHPEWARRVAQAQAARRNG